MSSTIWLSQDLAGISCMSMAEMFLVTYNGLPDCDLDCAFAEYVIGISMGQGRILDRQPSLPEKIH
jgi:hypothetical protein